MQRHRGVDVTPPREPDMARALLVMITQNIGQVAYLNAQVHGIQKIFFVGSFLSRKNTISSQLLAYAINFWSKGNMSAQFFRHEGYFGSIGSFLSRARAKKPRSGSMDCGRASGGKDAAAVVDGDGKEEEEKEKAAEGSQSATTGAA
jgi:pantothenate kinase